MKSLADFRNFADTILMPDLISIEASRRRVLFGVFLITIAVLLGIAGTGAIWAMAGYRAAVIFALAATFALTVKNIPGKPDIIKFVFIMLLFGAILLASEKTWVFFLIMSPFFIFGCYRALFLSVSKKYAAEFGQAILGKTAKFIDERLDYVKDASVDESRFRMSSIFDRSPDMVSGSDMVFGKIGPVDMICSFLLAQFQTQPLPARPPQIFTIFNGIFCAIKLEKNLGPKTFIMTRSSSYRYKFNPEIYSLPQIKDLNSREFDKKFEVHSELEVRTRDMLDDKILKEIAEFAATMKKRIYISMIANTLYVAIESQLNPLAVPVFRSPMDFGFLKKYYEVLAFPLRLALDLEGK